MAELAPTPAPVAAPKPLSPLVATGIEQAWIFGSVLAGLMLIFTVIRFTRRFSHKAPASMVHTSRRCRKQLLGGIAGFPSKGHALLVVLYVVLNIIFTVTNLHEMGLEAIGARTGWMALFNFVFLVFLALKNTPLAILTEYSYERLNYFHQVAGYTTVVLVVVHLLLYSALYYEENKADDLINLKNTMGIIAACAMVIIAGTGLFLMRRRYEIFYALHIAMFIIAAITTSRHRPLWRHQVPKFICVLGAFWSIDRLIRIGRILYNSVNNEARIEVLPNEMMRIVLTKRLGGAVAGQHCFLWIPRVRLFETHPFTIVSNTSAGVELIAKAQDGFTRSLFTLASTAENDMALFASVDGPYGSHPDLTQFDRVILLSGGSGGSFTFGLLNSLIQSQRAETNPAVNVIWATRKHENIRWFTDHIKALGSQDAKIDMTVYITNHTASSTSHLQEITEPALRYFRNIREKISHSTGDHSPDTDTIEQAGDTNLSSEKEDSHVSVSKMGRNWEIKFEKLQLELAIGQALRAAEPSQRVLIATCGPQRMGRAVRELVTRLLPVEGPSVDFHIETFSW